MFNDNGSFLLALFEFFLFFAWFMCLFWVYGDIFRSKDLGGRAKTFWIIFVIIIPWQQAKAMQAAQTDYIKSVAGSGSSPTEQIASAKSLLDSGSITQAEFDQLKAKALA